MSLEDLSFEQAFEQLQATIQTLEEGGLTLEESIAQFELGTRLANLCNSMLNRAEMRVSRLLAGEEETMDGAGLLLAPESALLKAEDSGLRAKNNPR